MTERLPSMTLARILCFVTILSLPSLAQSSGPDVIVGAIHAVSSFGSVGSTAAFSVGTTSCNVGDQPVAWFAGTSAHPVVAQNIYRIKNGRLQQIGLSWLKHGFSAVSGGLCGTCTGDPSGQTLGVGCSDPYSSALNGTQSGLGMRSEVNPFTGVFPYPFTSPSFSGALARRVQIAHNDIDPTMNAGAVYLAEGHYVTADDAQAGNGYNNASCRGVVFNPTSGTFGIAFAPASTTIRTSAVAAWKLIDPTVVVQNIDIPGDGRLVLGFKQIDLGGGLFRYEYAVFNLNSDRGVKSMSIALPPSAVVNNIGFSDVNYHSGEPWNGNDWTSSFSGGQLTWTTVDHSIDPNANALRWSTCYSFWFETTAFPAATTFELFKPGTPTTVTNPSPLPPFTYTIDGGAPTHLTPGVQTPIGITTSNLHGAPATTGGQLFYRVDNAMSFTPAPIAFDGSGQFSTTLPPLPPFARIEYYVSMPPVGGGADVILPVTAPTTNFVAEADVTAIQSVFVDNFETNMGWTTSSISAFAGFWARDIPNPAGGPGTTPVDFDGSGRCYVTGNGTNADVDFGSVLLTSPTINLAGRTDVRLNVAIWYDNDSGNFANEDVFTIEVSSNNGGSWTTVDTWGGNTNTWVERHFRLGAYTTFTSTMRFRFTATDLIHDSTIEAAVDAFKLEVPAVGLVTPCAAGNVGVNGAGGPYDVLAINGSSGGSARRVDIGYGVPIAISLANPPTNIFASGFTVFGLLRVAVPGEEQTLPSTLGTMCFAPCPYFPNDFTRFALMDNIAASIGCPPIVGSFPAPFTYTFNPGLFFDVVFTLQGLIIDPSDPLSLSITNAVIGNVDGP